MKLCAGAVFSIPRYIYILPLYILSLFTATRSFAEVRVFPNQYIIKKGLSVLNKDLNKDIVREKSNLGLGYSLVSKVESALSLTATDIEGSILYDPRRDRCPELIASGVALSCSPNFLIQLKNTTKSLPNDENYSAQWALSNESGINAIGAWETTTGSSDVVVAVIDTGIDYTHPDLAASTWQNPNEIPGNGLDDDGNGVIDDVHGFNALNGSGDPFDDNMHGSHVSGSIAAQSNNGIGITGVSWNAKIMGLKFLNSRGAGGVAQAISALNYVAMMKARGINIRVANNSWGGDANSEPLKNALQAVADLGISIVVAAGNSSENNDTASSFPANYALPGLISVGATDKNQELATFSNYGVTSVHIAAPGASILSTIPSGLYRTLSGTSMAAPHVSGALALLYTSYPSLSVNDARTWIMESGEPLSSLNGKIISGRKLNTSNLVRAILQPVLPPSKPIVTCPFVGEEINGISVSNLSSAPIILQGDELAFTEFNLPFTFPFYEQSISKVYLSTNGVLYLGNRPTTMDFKSSGSAPRNAIAALQTDLIMLEEGQGVRVSANAEEATFYWLGRHFSNPLSSKVEVWLTLNKNGGVKIAIRTDSKATDRALSESALIGITGSKEGERTVFPVMATEIQSGLQVGFTRSCNRDAGGEVTVNTLQVNLPAKLVRSKEQLVSPGNPLQLVLGGSGTGNVKLAIKLGERSCPTDLTVSMVNGSGVISGKLPRKNVGVKRLSFNTDGVSSELRLKRNQKVGKISSKKFCEQMQLSFR
jgi:subtilisin family serine protease